MSMRVCMCVCPAIGASSADATARSNVREREDPGTILSKVSATSGRRYGRGGRHYAVKSAFLCFFRL